jgi:putative addiction module component (TIGR02574 family)
MTRSQVVAEALKLDPEDRIEVAQQLLASLDNLSEGEIEALWLVEAERRDQALDKGEFKSIPAEEVFANLRFRLK